MRARIAVCGLTLLAVASFGQSGCQQNRSRSSGDRPDGAQPGAYAAVRSATQPAAAAATQPATQPASQLPDYPRVNLAPIYEVDASWPQARPANVNWGQMPSVAVDRDDNVWLFTRASPPVQVYSADGKYLKGWGDDIVKTAHHLKIDKDGNVWIADVGNHTVRKCTQDGKVLLTLGTLNERGIDEKHLNMPTDMVVSPAGDIFVSDGYGNSRVVHFDKDGKFVKAWGTLGIGAKQFSLPHAIDMDSKGRLYIADRNNIRVQVYSQEGELLDSWKDVIVPWGFWMSDKDEVWVCGSSPSPWRVDPKYPTAPLGCPPKDQVFMKFDAAGKLLQLWTIPKGEDEKEKPGELNWLHGIALDSKGNIYAGDIIGKRLQKFVRKQ